MSMREYPQIEQCAFYVDYVVAAYIMLAIDRAAGEVPEEVQNILDEGPEAFAKAVSNYDKRLQALDYLDPCLAAEYTEGNLDALDGYIAQYSNFDGTVESSYPERTNDPIADSLCEDSFGLVLPSKESTPFNQAYASEEELLEEYKERFKGILPDDFDYWRHVVNINGTIFG